MNLTHHTSRLGIKYNFPFSYYYSNYDFNRSYMGLLSTFLQVPILAFIGSNILDINYQHGENMG